jgi:hypothetical protein
MLGLLRKVRARIGTMLSPEPARPVGTPVGGAWLPPVLGAADWSHGLIASMADCDTGWYFERRPPR